MCAQSLSHVRLFATLWTVARQAPLSMGFSRKEYWSGLPCPPPGDLPNPGVKSASPESPALQADSLPLEPSGKLMVYHISSRILGFPGGASGKEPACQCRRCKKHVFDPLVRKIPWRRAWQPTPVSLPGESHEQRSLVGYSP